ncbi:MAG TPA: glycosyltransferase family 2 protein [Bacteroidia bacterium]|nr:glycosyltransferase family 2 protein [Bacteroidia bacterium]
MSTVKLSYILTTFNKLPYLSITLPLLMAARQNDEEIVVVDGGSNDGSAAYLEKLFRENKIQQFVSEQDSGEAHGLNKACLLAKGELVKIITDDDVFDFRVIQHCKQFMLGNRSIDILAYDGYSCRISTHPKFELSHYAEAYRNWQKSSRAFLFCGLSFMIRRSSLSLLGLFSTAYKIVDMEYSLRVSSLHAKIAFYNGPGFVNLVNPASNSVKFYERLREEYKMLRRAYPRARINFRLNNPSLLIKEKLNMLLRKHDPSVSLPDEKVKELYLKLIQDSLHKLAESHPEQQRILVPFS